MTSATLMRALAPDWALDCPSSASCWAIHSHRPPHAMRISTTTRFDAHQKRLLDESRPRSKARRPPQLRHLPKDELHNRILLHHTQCGASLLCPGTTSAISQGFVGVLFAEL